MDKKFLIVIIIVILLGGGVFALIQFAREPVAPVAEDQIIAKPITVAPKAVLRGNRELTGLLPLNIRQGYVAIYDVFYQEEIVGKAVWTRIAENRTKVIQEINIPEIYQEETEATIVHSLDLKPKISKASATVRARGQSMSMQINTFIEDNLINTYMEANGYVLPAISDEIIPNTVAKINIQDLYVGWEAGNVRVVEKTSVTAPAGAFEVFVVEISGIAMGAERKTTYYVTPAGKMIKVNVYVPDIPELKFPIVAKLRSYLPQ